MGESRHSTCKISLEVSRFFIFPNKHFQNLTDNKIFFHHKDKHNRRVTLLSCFNSVVDSRRVKQREEGKIQSYFNIKRG